MEKHTLGSTWEQKVKAWLLDRLLTADEKRTLALKRMGYGFYTTEPMETVTLSTQVILNSKQHEYLATSKGKAKYDVLYGLTRQLADELKNYVQYREWYEMDTDEWVCRVDVKVVKENEREQVGMDRGMR